MKKRLLSLLLAMVFAFTLLPAFAAAEGSDTKTGNSTMAVTIGGTTKYYDSQQEGWNAAAGYADGTAVTVQLLANWTATSGSLGTVAGFDSGAICVPSGKTITLDLNGYDIDRGLTDARSKGNVIRILGKLTLTDTSATTVDNQGKIKGGNDVDGGGGVYVTGALTMNGGSITNNTASSGGGAGGGVYVYGGSFTVGGTAVVSGNHKGTDNTAGDYDNNVYLPSGKTITCSPDTPLTTGASIGVTTEATPPH